MHKYFRFSLKRHIRFPRRVQHYILWPLFVILSSGVAAATPDVAAVGAVATVALWVFVFSWPSGENIICIFTLPTEIYSQVRAVGVSPCPQDPPIWRVWAIEEQPYRRNCVSSCSTWLLLLRRLWASVCITLNYILNIELTLLLLLLLLLLLTWPYLPRPLYGKPASALPLVRLSGKSNSFVAFLQLNFCGSMVVAIAWLHRRLWALGSAHPSECPSSFAWLLFHLIFWWRKQIRRTTCQFSEFVELSRHHFHISHLPFGISQSQWLCILAPGVLGFSCNYGLIKYSQINRRISSKSYINSTS